MHSHSSFLEALAQCLIRDRPKLHVQFDKLQRLRAQGHAIERLQNEFDAALARSQHKAQQRKNSCPDPVFDESLPVNQRRAELLLAIEQHPVVIVCGETGSGKTTQLPKLCLALGRGIYGLIGHTQPRRIAARSVATRLAQELGSRVGEVVGYKVRFNDQLSDRSLIKLMTDGILLAETQSDRDLLAYDTLIIDEAHERSLNIDFLLGYVKHLLPCRPDLKIIITSASIDAERFARHFNAAPIIEVSGRLYPITIRYRPLWQKEADVREIEMEDAIVEAAHELIRQVAGDLLVFLPGEREIRDTAEKLRQSSLKGIEILPLLARLSHEEQQRIFHPGQYRRIILATNVAETSLTVPGIGGVIDTGLARLKRYSPRAKVEQLQIEKISQAAAQQRAGRCGRVAAGVCLRLYSAEDFSARSPFTDPEILRSNLAAVLLRMAALQLGPIEHFPFIDQPSTRQIADAQQTLFELNACHEDGVLTSIGQKLARMPIDPRLGRILLAAEDFDCLYEILIIASALSLQDPREQPFEARAAANQAHARFNDEHSDFLAYLGLWDFFQQALQQKKSQRQLIAYCHQHYLSYLRLRQWRDIHSQLAEVAAQLGLKGQGQPTSPTAALRPKAQQQVAMQKYQNVHKALLSGLISQIACKAPEGEHYVSARARHCAIFPASGLKKKRPKWLLAAQLVETSKLYARTVARIEPEWVEAIAQQLIKTHYFDPHWDKARGEVVAYSRLTLYNLTLVARRTVSFGRIDPVVARSVFIRGALVACDYDSHAPYRQHNQRLIDEIQQLAHKARSLDAWVDDEVLYAFYDARLPADIVDAARFEYWRTDAEARDAQCLFMTRDELMQHVDAAVTEAQFPDEIDDFVGQWPLSYHFSPTHPLDGVTVDISLAQLHRIESPRFSWLVPGMVREKIQALIKALPKAFRRDCMPLSDCVTQFLESQLDKNDSLISQLAAFLSQRLGRKLDITLFNEESLSQHLRFNFRINDESGQEIAQGRDLNRLKQQFAHVAKLSLHTSAHRFERRELTAWDFEDLPPSLTVSRNQQTFMAYPALVKEHDQLNLRLFDSEAAAQGAHRIGVIYLLEQELKAWLKQYSKTLEHSKLALPFRAAIDANTFYADALAALCDRAFIGEDPLPRSLIAFNEQKSRARARCPAVAQALEQLLGQIGVLYQALRLKLPKQALEKALTQQLSRLIYPGFLAATPWNQLIHFPRYLKAMSLRLDKYPTHSQRDEQHAEAIRALFEQWEAKIARLQAYGDVSDELMAFPWLIEELRVSLFAQELKTPIPVSLKRLQKKLAQE